MLWLRSIVFYLSVTLIALFIGGIAGREWGLTFALVVVSLTCLFHIFNLHRLYHWLQNPQVDNVPSSFLLWQEVFDQFYTEVRKQKKAKERLANTLDRFLSAAEALPDGVVILDEYDRIEWCNPASCDHLALNRKTDTGQPITHLLRHPSLREYLKQEDFSHPIVIRTTRPTEQTLSAQMVPFDSTRKLLLSRDITQLERVQTVHRDFVANVSHELRTPLTVVGGFIETMIDMPASDAQTRDTHLQLMYEQTQRMQRLVDDLLTLSKLESGAQVREEEVDIPQLMQLLRTEGMGLSQGRHTVEIGKLERARLIGNNDELHSALGNLVSNAIRYTPAGGKITIGWERRDDMLCFTCRDTGIGIAPEHIPRLTERFYRVDRGRSRNTGGTGLGLAIVKHILHRHQAQLCITSEPGKGSEFAVKFPATRIIE
ncbi:phosphate regulon sensor histidine kinase PhoR [Chitinibacter tainanensis]|uniref:phosphate regulon sensor histidine kinase PhoR n=1 Tax=Chitinibacter tainanensis TaxID=230667 RepID=UPI000688830E|nr:phosphate regulon sensor histidine kinase PhoR [Chitinibacter tainanensis]